MCSVELATLAITTSAAAYGAVEQRRQSKKPVPGAPPPPAPTAEEYRSPEAKEDAPTDTRASLRMIRAGNVPNAGLQIRRSADGSSSPRG